MIVCLTLVGVAVAAAFDGRWKDDGNGGCVFDATDTGSDQCTPPEGSSPATAKGRAAGTASRRGQ
jgi:hypothetical protein